MDQLLEVESVKCYNWCKDNKRCRPRLKLTTSGIGRSKKTVYPELQSQYKAMDVKIYCLWLRHRVVEVWGADPEELRAKMVVACVWALAELSAVFDHGGIGVTAAESRNARWAIGPTRDPPGGGRGREGGAPQDRGGRCPQPSRRRYGDLYLQSYQWLANEADDFGIANGSNRANYKLRPKLHSVQHMSRRPIFNPRRVQTDTDESFMNIIKKIGRSTHGLNSMLRVAQRWQLGIACRFKRKSL